MGISITRSQRKMLASDFLIHPRDFRRAMSPEEFPFHFINDVGLVHIESARQVLPSAAYEHLQWMHSKEPFKIGTCHSSAAAVALALCDYGIRYCDGYCSKDGVSATHSFCEYKGRYFDPTIEYGANMYEVRSYDYYSWRLFESAEILLFFGATTVHFNDKSYYYPSTFYNSTDFGGYKRAWIDDDGLIHFVE